MSAMLNGALPLHKTATPRASQVTNLSAANGAKPPQTPGAAPKAAKALPSAAAVAPRAVAVKTPGSGAAYARRDLASLAAAAMAPSSRPALLVSASSSSAQRQNEAAREAAAPAQSAAALSSGARSTPSAARVLDGSKASAAQVAAPVGSSAEAAAMAGSSHVPPAPEDADPLFADEASDDENQPAAGAGRAASHGSADGDREAAGDGDGGEEGPEPLVAPGPDEPPVGMPKDDLGIDGVVAGLAGAASKMEDFKAQRARLAGEEIPTRKMFVVLSQELYSLVLDPACLVHYRDILLWHVARTRVNPPARWFLEINIRGNAKSKTGPRLLVEYYKTAYPDAFGTLQLDDVSPPSDRTDLGREVMRFHKNLRNAVNMGVNRLCLAVEKVHQWHLDLCSTEEQRAAAQRERAAAKDTRVPAKETRVSAKAAGMAGRPTLEDVEPEALAPPPPPPPAGSGGAGASSARSAEPGSGILARAQLNGTVGGSVIDGTSNGGSRMIHPGSVLRHASEGGGGRGAVRAAGAAAACLSDGEADDTGADASSGSSSVGSKRMFREAFALALAAAQLMDRAKRFQSEGAAACDDVAVASDAASDDRSAEAMWAASFVPEVLALGSNLYKMPERLRDRIRIEMAEHAVRPLRAVMRKSCIPALNGPLYGCERSPCPACVPVQQTSPQSVRFAESPIIYPIEARTEASPGGDGSGSSCDSSGRTDSSSSDRSSCCSSNSSCNSSSDKGSPT